MRKLEKMFKELLEVVREALRKHWEYWWEIEEEIRKAKPVRLQLKPAGMLTAVDGKHAGSKGVFVMFQGRGKLVPKRTLYRKGTWMCWEARDVKRCCELCCWFFSYEGPGLPEMFYAYCVAARTLCLLWRVEG